ncbi:MAG: hypothetical protein KGD63_00960 [Candidatus Lokiarchaeota archaeon]|nr:hypothetical protein [Candidatus Lokiarchaeota archaeon]
MHIYEAGIIIGGIPIIGSNYINPNEKDIDLIQKCALLSCILDFADLLISPIEYLESNRYCFAFSKRYIETIDMEDSDIYAYLVINKYKNFHKEVKDKFYPVLETLLNEFIRRYNGFNFSFSFQFTEFRNFIDKTLGPSTLTLEEKVELLFG